MNSNESSDTNYHFYVPSDKKNKEDESNPISVGIVPLNLFVSDFLTKTKYESKPPVQFQKESPLDVPSRNWSRAESKLNSRGIVPTKLLSSDIL